MKKIMKRGTLNYMVDIIIGAAFLLSIFSGILLLFIPSGAGFKGGRSYESAVSILGMNRWVLKDIHNISSIIMAAGVLGHLILHWNWMVCMTRKLFKRKEDVAVKKCEVR